MSLRHPVVLERLLILLLIRERFYLIVLLICTPSSPLIGKTITDHPRSTAHFTTHPYTILPQFATHSFAFFTFDWYGNNPTILERLLILLLVLSSFIYTFWARFTSHSWQEEPQSNDLEYCGAWRRFLILLLILDSLLRILTLYGVPWRFLILLLLLLLILTLYWQEYPRTPSSWSAAKCRDDFSFYYLFWTHCPYLFVHFIDRNNHEGD